MYGYIYKIGNMINNKLYIGQTTRTVEQRFQEHLSHATATSLRNQHLYAAMRLYGSDKFYIEQIDTASSQKELNEKEKYWISYYNSIEDGYNMMPGGSEENPMNSSTVKEKHDRKMRSAEVRAKISKTLSERLQKEGRSIEYRQKISKSQKDRQCFVKDGKITYTAGANIDKINQLLADGWENITKEKKLNKTKKCKQFATRSKAVYCILDTGERFDFESILLGGKWWYENYKPFGETYSSATYQRKIEASIAGKEIKYNAGHDSRKKHDKNMIIVINNIKWYYRDKEVVIKYE